MGDDVKENLRELIDTQGQQILYDPNKFTALMLDLCLGANKREINILAAALTEKIPQHLQSSASKSLTEELRANLSNRLENETGLHADAATWAINTWAEALGIEVSPVLSPEKHTTRQGHIDSKGGPAQIEVEAIVSHKPKKGLRAWMVATCLVGTLVIIGIAIYTVSIKPGLNGIPWVVNRIPGAQTSLPVVSDNQSVKPQSPVVVDIAAVRANPEISGQENIEILDAADTQLILQHYGQKVKVQGKVVRFNTVYDDNKRPLMLFFTDWDLTYDAWQKSQAGTFFKAMLYKENNNKFPAIDECYQQDILVEGTIELFKSAPVIILKDPAQIKLVNKQPLRINLPENLKDTKITFVSDRDSFVDPLLWGYDGQGEIYTMNADGSNAIRLTESGGRNRCPEWSPDRNRIAFMSDRDSIYPSAWDIYVMDADGSNVKRLTKDHARNLNPRWSPDGRMITFASDFGATNLLQIYVMNADGSDIRQVTSTMRPSSCYGPCFTADGKGIIFVSNQEGSWAIYKVALAAGTNITNLTQIDNKEVAWPTVSPDGKKIAYYQNVGKWTDLQNPDYKIFVMNIDGTDKKRISFSPLSQYDEMVISDYYPAWSPDGSKIIFTSNRSPGLWQRSSTTVRRQWVSQIYVVDIDGTNMYRMPYVWGNSWFPSWK